MADQENSEQATRVFTPVAAETSLPTGSLLLHTYRVEKMLAHGGMGEVYLARHTRLDSLHAIKVIRPELITDPTVLALFEREASVLREIHHEAVVGYEGFNLDESDRRYLIMEYVQGPSLAKLLEEGRSLTLDEFYVLRDRICQGLAAAHAKGVIHRDLSPDNVILPEGQVDNTKLIDFGIAKLARAEVQTIIAGGFAGKFRYASPEQMHLNDHPVDAVSDIYSLGLVLVAAACGQPLEMGNDFMSAALARKTVPDLSAVPAELREQLTAMLQPDPDRRPQSLAELLDRWPAPKRRGVKLPVKPPAGGKVRPPGQPGGVGRYVLPAVLVVAVLLTAGGGYWLKGVLWPETLVVVKPPAVDKPIKPAVDKPPVVDKPATTTTPPSTASIPTATPATPATPVATTPCGDLLALPLDTITPRIATLSAADAYNCGSAFYSRDRLDVALVLWEESARQNYGPAALKLGELYDPVRWGQQRSPFSKANPIQAEKWYKRASTLGVAEANARLAALATWQQQQ